MVVDDELKKALTELRALGVKRIAFRENYSAKPSEVEFFEQVGAPPAEEKPDEEQTEEPEIPMGYLNAANAFKPKKQGAA